MELVALMPFLERAHQVDGLQPLVQRDVAALEDGADRDRELLAQCPHLRTPGRVLLPFSVVDAIRRAAVRADRAVRPEHRFQMPRRGSVVMQVRSGKVWKRSPSDSPDPERIAFHVGTSTI